VVVSAVSTITSAEYVKIVDRSLTERQWQDKVVDTAKALGWMIFGVATWVLVELRGLE